MNLGNDDPSDTNAQETTSEVVAGEAAMTFPQKREVFLARAKDMLKDRKHSFVDIAKALGYKSVKSFSGAFTNAAGEPPETYRNREAGKKPLSSRIIRAQDLLRTTDKNHDEIARDDLVKYASANSFGKCFTMITGETPAAYRERTQTTDRVNEAQKLLETSHMTLMQIAKKVGFHEDSSLSFAYKRLKGERPGEYRRRFRLEKAKEMLATTSLPSDQIAPQAGFKSIGSLRSAMRTGMTIEPGALRRSLWLENAKNLLENTDKPEEEIAAEVGYETTGYMRGAFVRKTGMSPDEYRLRARTEKAELNKEDKPEMNDTGMGSEEAFDI